MTEQLRLPFIVALASVLLAGCPTRTIYYDAGADALSTGGSSASGGRAGSGGSTKGSGGGGGQAGMSLNPNGGTAGATVGQTGGATAGSAGQAGGSGGRSTTGGSGGQGAAGSVGSGGGAGTGGARASGGATGTAAHGGTLGAGGSPATGGMLGTGGVAATGGAGGTGGVSATGGTSGCTPTCVAPAGGTSTCVGGTCMPKCSTSGQVLCNNNSTCVDLAISHDNCGMCGKSCEAYQFCAASKCVPTYEATRVLPITTNGDPSSTSVLGAAEESNGDILVQVLAASAKVTFSAPTEYGNWVDAGTGYASGLARYTSGGALVWGRDLAQVLGSSSQPISVDQGFCPFSLAPNGDVMFGYLKANPPPSGPVPQTSQYRVGRINGNDPSVLWEATIPSGSDACRIVPRSAKNDFVSYGRAPDTFRGLTGAVFEIPNNGSTANYLGPNWTYGQVAGKDGATIWEWTYGYAGSAQLNPWSSMTWNLIDNPSMSGGVDAAIIGVQDGGSAATPGSGQQIGPWISEGDYGPRYQLAVDGNGDLVVSLTSGGITRINGGMSLVSGAGSALVKLSGTTGNVLWQTNIPTQTTAISMAPGNRIAVVADALDASTGTADTKMPYVLSFYSGADGSLLTSFSAGSGALQLASGTTDLYVVGVSTGSADFNPGSANDPSVSPCVFISRYTF